MGLSERFRMLCDSWQMYAPQYLSLPLTKTSKKRSPIWWQSISLKLDSKLQQNCELFNYLIIKKHQIRNKILMKINFRVSVDSHDTPDFPFHAHGQPKSSSSAATCEKISSKSQVERRAFIFSGGISESRFVYDAFTTTRSWCSSPSRKESHGGEWLMIPKKEFSMLIGGNISWLQARGGSWSEKNKQKQRNRSDREA